MNRTPVRTAAPSSYRWVVFALLATGYLLVFFHRLCPAVTALDLMADLGAGGTLLGLLGSAYFYPYALMQLPSGLLSDSFGPRRTVTLFFLLAGVGSVLFGLSQNVWQAVLFRVLVGTGVAMLFVPTMKILTNWFRKAEFATMTGILMAVGGLGALTAAEPLARLSSALGWRTGFMVVGGVTLLMAGAVWLFVRDTPQEMGLPPVEEESGRKSREEVALPEGLLHGVLGVLGTPRFWPPAVWFFFTSGVFFSFAGLWSGPYLMNVYGMTKSQAGTVLNVFALSIITGGPLISRWSDAWMKSRKKVLISTSAIFLASVLFPALYGVTGPIMRSSFAVYVLFYCIGAAGSASVVVGFAATKELFPLNRAGTAVGLMNIFPFFGGAVFQPVIGYVLESGGGSAGVYSAEAYETMFAWYAVSAAVALVAVLFIKETFTDSTA